MPAFGATDAENWRKLYPRASWARGASVHLAHPWRSTPAGGEACLSITFILARIFDSRQGTQLHEPTHGRRKRSSKLLRHVAQPYATYPRLQLHQFCELRGRYDGQRSAAEVHLTDLEWPCDMTRHHVDFTPQRCEIFGDGLFTPGNRRVATAISAHGSAERNMQIDRNRAVFQN